MRASVRIAHCCACSVRAMWRGAVQHGLVQRILAHGDRGDVEHRIDMRRAVVAEELAVGPFDLGVAGLVEIAFDHELGVRRHQQAVRHRAHHRQRRAAQVPTSANSSSTDARTQAARKSSGCAADREIDRQMLAALDRFEEHALEVGHLREVRAHGRARAQHQPAAADIAPAGHRIDRIVDRGRDIGRAVDTGAARGTAAS